MTFFAGQLTTEELLQERLAVQARIDYYRAINGQLSQDDDQIQEDSTRVHVEFDPKDGTGHGSTIMRSCVMRYGDRRDASRFATLASMSCGKVSARHQQLAFFGIENEA